MYLGQSIGQESRSGKFTLSVSIVVLGSAPLLIAQGLTESLAGRFEVIPLSHWSFSEMQAAFGWTLVESAVGAHLANAAMRGECRLHYGRERNHVVDFVIPAGRRLMAIEVKSGRAPQAHPGTAAFVEAFNPQRTLLVGGDGITLEDFLSQPVSHWVKP